jgi:hypothetical protein
VICGGVAMSRGDFWWTKILLEEDAEDEVKLAKTGGGAAADMLASCAGAGCATAASDEAAELIEAPSHGLKTLINVKLPHAEEGDGAERKGSSKV